MSSRSAYARRSSFTDDAGFSYGLGAPSRTWASIEAASFVIRATMRPPSICAIGRSSQCRGCSSRRTVARVPPSLVGSSAMPYVYARSGPDRIFRWTLKRLFTVHSNGASSYAIEKPPARVSTTNRALDFTSFSIGL